MIATPLSFFSSPYTYSNVYAAIAEGGFKPDSWTRSYFHDRCHRYGSLTHANLAFHQSKVRFLTLSLIQLKSAQHIQMITHHDISNPCHTKPATSVSSNLFGINVESFAWKMNNDGHSKWEKQISLKDIRTTVAAK